MACAGVVFQHHIVAQLLLTHLNAPTWWISLADFSDGLWKAAQDSNMGLDILKQVLRCIGSVCDSVVTGLVKAGGGNLQSLSVEVDPLDIDSDFKLDRAKNGRFAPVIRKLVRGA